MTTIYQFFSKARTRSSGFARVLSFLIIATLWGVGDVNAQTCGNIGFGNQSTNELQICVGTSTSISGNNVFALYGWDVSTNNGVSWNSVPGSSNTQNLSTTVMAQYYNNAGIYLLRRGAAGFSCTGYSDVITLRVGAPAQPGTITSNITSNFCLNTSRTYTVDEVPGATSYTWTLPSGLTGTSSTNSITVTATAAGTGDISVTASNSCGASVARTLSVTRYALPNVTGTASPTGTICYGGSVTLTGSGASTYTWDNGVTNGTSFNATTSNTYTVTGTDANGCVNTNQTAVTVGAQPTLTLAGGSGALTQTVCEGTSTFQNIVLNIGGAATGAQVTGLPSWATYAVSNSGTVVTISATSAPTFAAGASFSYTVTSLPNITGCPPAIVNGTINVSQAASAAVAGDDKTICADASTVTMTPTAPTVGTGLWTSTGAGTFSGNVYTPTTAELTNGATITATWTVTNGACVNTDNAIIKVNPLPVLSGAASLCFGAAVQLSPSTGGVWTSGNTSRATITGGGLASVATGATQGDVTFTFTQNSQNGGCVNTKTVAVTPQINITSASDYICGPTGTLQLAANVTGGTWSSTNGTGAATIDATTGLATATATGTVSFIYTAANGCTGTKQITVTALPTFTFAVSTSDAQTQVAIPAGGNTGVCVGATTQVQLHLAGTAGHTYELKKGNFIISSTGSTLPASVSFPVGTSVNETYTLKVTNPVTGCSDTKTYTINQGLTPVKGTFNVSNTTLCEDMKDFTITVTGLTPNVANTVFYKINTNPEQSFVVNTSNGSFTTPAITLPSAGTFTIAPTKVQITQNGVVCTTNYVTGDNKIITVKPTPVIAVPLTSVTVATNTCIGYSSLSATIAGVTPGTATNVKYTLNGVDKIAATTTGTTGNVTFSLETGLSAAQYTLSIKEITVNGCVSQPITGANAVFHIRPLPVATLNVNGDVLTTGTPYKICYPMDVSIGMNGVSGDAYELRQSGLTLPLATGSLNAVYGSFAAGASTSGTYTLKVTDQNYGCVSSKTYEIQANPTPSFALQNGSTTLTAEPVAFCEGANVALTLTGAPTGSTYTVSFNGGTPVPTTGANAIAFTSITEANEGAYTIEVTSAQGCKKSATYNVVVNPNPVYTLEMGTQAIVGGETLVYCFGEAIDFHISSASVSGTTAQTYTLTRPAYNDGTDSWTAMTITGNVNDPMVSNPAVMAWNGNWTLTVNRGNCTEVKQFTIIVNPTPKYEVSYGTTSIVDGGTYNFCEGENMVLNLVSTVSASAVNTDNQTYTLTPPNNGTPITGSFSVANPISSPQVAYNSYNGTWTLTIQRNGATQGMCTETIEFDVNVTPAPQFTASYNTTTIVNGGTYTFCEGESVENGINNMLTTGTQSYTLTAPTGSNIPDFNGSLASGANTFGPNPALLTWNGAWTLTVRNGDCDKQITFNVVVNPLPTLTINGTTNVTCNGASTGAFNYTFTGTQPGSVANPYVFTITNASNVQVYIANVPTNQLTANQTLLAAGVYNVKITTPSGCSVTEVVTISEPPAVTLSAVSDGSTLCTSPTSGKITIGFGGGVAPYVVTVAGPNTNTNFNFASSLSGFVVTNLGAGTYTVTVKDVNNCLVSQTATMVVPSANLTASVSTANANVCLNGTGTVTFVAPPLPNNGVAPFTFGYTVTGTTGVQTITTTGTSRTATLNMPTGVAGAFTYTLVSVTDANGTPCNTNITNNTATATIADCSVADLSPSMGLSSNNFTVAEPTKTLTLAIFNSGTAATTGQITVNIIKPHSSAILTVSTPGWTLTPIGNLLWRLTSTNVINGGESTVISGSITMNSGGTLASGSASLNANIQAGSGGETNSTNNSSGFNVQISN